MGVAGVVAAAGLAGLVGLSGGALVPFVAYRLSVPAGDPPRDQCVSCGRSLPGGWLRLDSRCASCATRWGPPAWLTAAIGAVCCGLIGYALGPRLELPLYVAAGVFGVLLGAIDCACKRLPHALVVPAIGVFGAVLAIVAAVSGDGAALIRAALGAAALAVVFGLLYLLPWRGLGLGDLKLGVALGGLLGWLGWREVWWGLLLAWLINGPVVLALLLAGRVGRRSMVPFGPALLAGALAAIVVGAWLDALGYAR